MDGVSAVRRTILDSIARHDHLLWSLMTKPERAEANRLVGLGHLTKGCAEGGRVAYFRGHEASWYGDAERA